MGVGEIVNLGGERVLGKVWRKKREGGVRRIAARGLEKRKNIVERAPRGMRRKERADD